MEQALIARLLGASAVAALVGTRVNWSERPQGEGLPAITLTKVSPGVDYTHSGAMALEGPRVQVDCWGATMAQAIALRSAVKATLEPTADIDGVRFVRGFYEGDGDHAPDDAGGGTKIYGTHADFILWHRPI